MLPAIYSHQVAAILGAAFQKPCRDVIDDPWLWIVHEKISRGYGHPVTDTMISKLRQDGCHPQVHGALESCALKNSQEQADAAREVGNLLLVMRGKFGADILKGLSKWSTRSVVREFHEIASLDESTTRLFLLRFTTRPYPPRSLGVLRAASRLGLALRPNDLERLWDRLPGGIRYDMFVGLERLSRYRCREKPDCANCEISKFCRFNRRRLQEAARSKRRPWAVDLFCGAGGTSSGFQRAGFRTALAVDCNQLAVDNFRLNHPEIPDKLVLKADLTKLPESKVKALLDGRRVKVLIGCPPCQGFSMAGARVRKRGKVTEFSDDPRNSLFLQVVRWARVIQPDFVVMENVLGLNSAKGGWYKREMLKALQRNKFLAESVVLDSERYGVPQRRRRVLIVAANAHKVGKGRAKARLLAVLDALEKSQLPEDGLVCLRQAIHDLPDLDPGDGSEALTRPQRRGRLSRYASRMRNGYPLVVNSRTRGHNPRDIERFTVLRPGEKYIDLVRKHRRPDLINYSLNSFLDKYRRLSPDNPAPTIVAHLERDANMFIHPDKPRGLSVREAARIQSFTDDFILVGPFAKQYRLVGNAVPPLLAESIGRAFRVVSASR